MTGIGNIWQRLNTRNERKLSHPRLEMGPYIMENFRMCEGKWGTGRKQVSKSLGTLAEPPLGSGLLFCFFETGSHCVAQAVLELMILLPQPPEFWNYRILGT
jgi:hypothetical protein